MRRSEQRRAAVIALGGYPAEFAFAQDLALWLKLAQPGRLGMVGEPLVDMREHRGQTTFSAGLTLRRHRESITIFESAQRLPGLSERAKRLGRMNLARIHCLLAGALLASGNATGALLELARGLRLAPVFCIQRAMAGRWRTALPGAQVPD